MVANEAGAKEEADPRSTRNDVHVIMRLPYRRERWQMCFADSNKLV